MKLTDLRAELKAHRRLYRAQWPHYASWQWMPAEGLRFIDQATHRWFWTEVMQEPVERGVPVGLTHEDIHANDWNVL